MDDLKKYAHEAVPEYDQIKVFCGKMVCVGFAAIAEVLKNGLYWICRDGGSVERLFAPALAAYREG